ncbi:MAG: iron-only hydrogenase system regulator [Spirochaetes bacterium]|nr:iron-only hydrogenase system regulator [Spirochaetota bacterium]
MEKRIGIIALVVIEKNSVPQLNTLFTEYSDIVLGRQGLPLKDKGIHVISLIVEGTTDQIGALTGKAGRLPGVQVKSVLTKLRGNDNELPGLE